MACGFVAANGLVVSPTTLERATGIEPALSAWERALSRTPAYWSGPSGQVRELSTRRRTAVNGGVRGIFAGCDLPAKSNLLWLAAVVSQTKYTYDGDGHRASLQG
jgi:hypothetical protein